MTNETSNKVNNSERRIRKKKKGGACRSTEGFYKNAIKNMVHGHQSRLLRKIRYCNVCPLGAKIRYVRNKAGFMEQVPVPAKCQHYQKNGRKCPIDKIDFINRCKYFYMLEDNDNISALKLLAGRSALDAEMASQIEMMQKGHPSDESRRHRELAANIFEKAEKLQTGEKHVVVSSGVNLGDVMQEINKKRKIVDAEVVEDAGESSDKNTEDDTSGQCGEQCSTEEDNKEATKQTDKKGEDANMEDIQESTEEGG